MTHSLLKRSNFFNLTAAAAATALLALAGTAQAALPAEAAFSAIGDVANYSSPGVWEHHQLDVSAWAGGASAQLNFDFANDLPGTGSTSTNHATNAHLLFAADAAGYYLNFEFFLGAEGNGLPADSSAHLRNVSITVNGVSTSDQFGAFNNHFGDALQGSAIDGWGAGINALGQTGFEGRTYIMSTSAVPEPATYALVLAGLLTAVTLSRRRAAQQA